MKQKKIIFSHPLLNQTTLSIALLSFLQSAVLPIGVQAQTSVTGSSGNGTLGAVASGIANTLPAFFGQAPTTPDFSTANTNLNAALLACEAGLNPNTGKTASGLVDSVKSSANNLLNAKSTATSAVVSDPKCEAKCGELKPDDLSEEPSCDKYADQEKELEIPIANGGLERIRTRQARGNAAAQISKAQKSIKDYVSCLSAKKECGNAQAELVKKQMEAFNCKMGVLQKSIQDASQVLQKSIQSNQEVYGQMNQYQGELAQQKQQIDEILGPDPELAGSGASQFQGLLGLKKELDASLPKMTSEEAEFKNATQKLKNDTEINEQNLDASRVQVATSCMSGERNVGVAGGYSLTCWTPIQTTTGNGANGQPTTTNVYDKNGNIRYQKQACGPFQFIRQKIEQNALLNSKGQVLKSQDRIDKGQANAVAYDSLVQSMLRELGSSDKAGEGNAKLETRINSWDDIEKKYASNMSAITRTSGVDIRGMLRTMAGHCFQEASIWKNQQIRSQASDYNKMKNKIREERVALTSKMDQGLTALNKSYTDLYAVLADRHMSIDRSTCTKDNPEAMQKCYADMRQEIQNIVEGNSSKVRPTAKTIKGGKFASNYVVQCRGLNGCIAAFSSVRKQQKEMITDAAKKKNDWVNQGNQATQKQMQTYTSNLSTIQNDVLKQYDAIKKSLMAMGVDAPEQPKFMQPETLQAMEGADKLPGPYNYPKSMAAVLSGQMQPSGMIDFADTGMREPIKDLNKKVAEDKAKLAEDLKAAKTMQSKYADIKSFCNISNLTLAPGAGENSVGISKLSCEDAEKAVNSCSKAQTKSLNRYRKESKAFDDEIAELNKKLEVVSKALENPKATESEKLSLQEKMEQYEKKIQSLKDSKESLGEEPVKMDNPFGELITALQAYKQNDAKWVDKSKSLDKVSSELNEFFTGTNDYCESAKAQIQACSSYLKQTYTESQKLRDEASGADKATSH